MGLVRPPAAGHPRAALAAAAAAVAAACCACSAPAPQAPPPVAGPGDAGVVERVVDGDTLIARIDGARVRVRLLGVDAPESAAGYGSAECFGAEASEEARRLLPRGARVDLVTDATQGPYDRFGRRLAEVTVRGRDRTVNEDLIAGGAAEVFRGDGRARLLPALLAAERAARSARLGLWSACRGG
jgi:micrococcal nuclease